MANHWPLFTCFSAPSILFFLRCLSKRSILVLNSGIGASFFKDFYLFILERGEGREKKRERNIDVRNIHQLNLVHAPTGEQTCNLGMCPDWESNQRPFTFWDDPKLTEPHGSGLELLFTFQLEVPSLLCFHDLTITPSE